MSPLKQFIRSVTPLVSISLGEKETSRHQTNQENIHEQQYFIYSLTNRKGWDKDSRENSRLWNVKVVPLERHQPLAKSHMYSNKATCRAGKLGNRALRSIENLDISKIE